jgi:RHS repeat-associated protein
MCLPSRKFDAGSGYRYGFNGKENDNSSGEGNLDFGARIYDGRLGRWLSVDPLQKKYPNLSPYNFAADNPIVFVDPDGKVIRLFLENGNYFDYTPGMVVTDKNVINSAFFQQVSSAINYNMNTEIGTSIWTELASAKGVLEIRKINVQLGDDAGKSTRYETEKLGKKSENDGKDMIGVIFWDPAIDLFVKDPSNAYNIEGKGFLSPSTAVLHEGGHALEGNKALVNSKTIEGKNAIEEFKESAIEGRGDEPGTPKEEVRNLEVEHKYVRQINEYEQKKGGASRQGIRKKYTDGEQRVQRKFTPGVKLPDINTVDPRTYNNWKRTYPNDAAKDEKGH